MKLVRASLLTCLVFIAAPLVHAESIIWSTTLPDMHISNPTEYEMVWSNNGRPAGSAMTGGGTGAFMDPNGGSSNPTQICSVKAANNLIIQGTHVQVTYMVEAANVDTGTILACDGSASVAKGTKVRYRFIPHEPEHIYWFNSGTSFDSPYGAWVNDPSSPPTSCRPEDALTGSEGAAFGKAYVKPPVKTLTGLDSFSSCTGSATDKTCTASTEGVFTPTFNWAETPGVFTETYVFWGNSCQAQGCTMGGNTGSYTVAADHVICPIRVGNTPEDPEQPEDPENPSGPPTLSTSSGGACVIGTPHTISMTATDAQGDKVRYLIDWDANGTVDQFIPGSGWVDSGVPQSASRTYATGGAKTVKVRAEDEHHMLSSWKTITFSCAESATVGLNENDGTNGGGIGGDDSSALDLTIRALPSLVRGGNTTKVNWNASGVASCTVTAPNGDSWNGLQSVLGGYVSKPISGETVYTLRCLDAQDGVHTKSATVRVLPSWVEK